MMNSAQPGTGDAAANNRPDFRSLVLSDVGALGGGTKSIVFYLAAALGLSKFSAVFLFRISAHLRGKGRGSRILSAAAYRWNAIVNSCEISPAAEIGAGFYLPHPIGIVIGPISAGPGLTVLQNVTMGLRDRSVDENDRSNYPVLGSGVQVGPGAVLMGPIRVGDNGRVGANAVLLDDLPADAVAVGTKAGIRQPKGA